MSDDVPVEDRAEDPYVYRQPAGYAASLDQVREVEELTVPRLAAIPQLPPQEYNWNYRVSGRGIYDDPAPAPEVSVPPAPLPPPGGVPVGVVPVAHQPFPQPAAPPSGGRGAVVAAWCFASVAVVEGVVIALLATGVL